MLTMSWAGATSLRTVSDMKGGVGKRNMDGRLRTGPRMGEHLCPAGVARSPHCGEGPKYAGGRWPSWCLPHPQPPLLRGLTDKVAMASGIQITHWPDKTSHQGWYACCHS